MYMYMYMYITRCGPSAPKMPKSCECEYMSAYVYVDNVMRPIGSEKVQELRVRMYVN